MITQAMKNWFRKMFAWWPWKQSTPLAYPYVSSAVSSKATSETYLWTSRDETIPQAGATPRRITLDSRAERLASETPPFSTPVAFLHTNSDASGELDEPSPGTPTRLQRLEFLRYLVQHGIVNEGFENDQADSSS